MTGLVQTLVGATKSRALSPLNVTRDSNSPWTLGLARLQTGWTSLDIFDTILITTNIYDLSAWDDWSLVSIWSCITQNRESTEEYSRWIIEKRLRKFGKTGLNNWSINKSLKGTETGVRKVKLSMRACHTRCKCSMETTRIFVKVKLGIKVLEFVKSLIGGKSL